VDPVECGSYRGIKLFEHDMQFGFMKGKGTTDAIFIVRQMQEKFRAKGKKLCFDFVDWKKLLIWFQVK